MYFNAGQWDKAEAVYAQAVAILESHQLGLEDPEVAKCLSKLAGMYVINGKYEAAKPLLERALVIMASTLGPNHPNVADPLHNLAKLYLGEGRHEEAEAHFKRALEVTEAAGGLLTQI